MQVVMSRQKDGGQANADVIQYVIDGQNRRIARKVNGKVTNKWLYAGQLSPVAELDSADNIIARFSGGYLNKRDTIYQIITDHLESPRLVINVSTGDVVQRMDRVYPAFSGDEFGNVIYDSNPGFQPFGFAGGPYDPETKLVRFGARDYDAATGRWRSKDPLGFGGGVTNLFEYAVGDPLNRADRFGLQAVPYLTPDYATAIGSAGEKVSNFANGVKWDEVARTIAIAKVSESLSERTNIPAIVYDIILDVPEAGKVHDTHGVSQCQQSISNSDSQYARSDATRTPSQPVNPLPPSNVPVIPQPTYPTSYPR